MNGYQSFRLGVFEAYNDALITESTKDRLLDFSDDKKYDLITYTEGVKDIQTAMYIIRLNNIRNASPDPETADQLTIDFVNKNYAQLVNYIESLQKVDVVSDEKKARLVIMIVNAVVLLANHFIGYFSHTGLTLIEVGLGSLTIVFFNILADVIIKALSKAQVNAQSNLINLKKDLLSIAYTRNVTNQERAQLEAIANKIQDVM